VLKELMSLRLVVVQSTGMKRTVVVADHTQFAHWVDANYPEHSIDPDTLPRRQRNIVRHGSSKSGKRSHAQLPFLFKWFGQGNERLARLTHDHGIIAVLTDILETLELPRRWQLLTIENWESFFRADYAAASLPVMVAYLGGSVSDTIINALKTFTHPPERILHFGDYDWEGLYIFQRLQKEIPLAKLFIPDNIEALFNEFGNRKLVEKQKIKAGFNLENQQCLPVIQLIQETNYGLEQEIVDFPEMV
jgi:hypothetical protein